MSDRTTTMELPDGAVLRLADGSTVPLVGDLAIDTDIERVRTDRAWKPNLKWSYTDPNGHPHTYVRDEDDVPRLPTLERRTRIEPCDGSCGNWDCDGYRVTEWFCRECGVQVEPGFVPDTLASELGIPVAQIDRYTLTAQMPIPSAPGGVIKIGVGESLFPPIEGATIVVIDEQGTEVRMPVPTLLAGDNLDFTAGSGQVQVELYGEEHKLIERKPTGP